MSRPAFIGPVPDELVVLLYCIWSVTQEKAEASALTRFVEPNQMILSPEAAEAILAIGFSQTDKDRMQELAARTCRYPDPGGAGRGRSLWPRRQPDLNPQIHGSPVGEKWSWA